MVNFSDALISQIKEASDEKHVVTIIENSMLDLDSKNNNGFSTKWKYMMNMVLALKYARAEGLSPSSLTNINKAIDVFEVLRKEDQGSLF